MGTNQLNNTTQGGLLLAIRQNQISNTKRNCQQKFTRVYFAYELH